MGKSTRGVELASVDDLDQRQAASWMKQAAAMPFIGGRRPGIGWPASLTRVQGSSVAPRRRSPSRVQQITAPVCTCPPLGVALRIAPETYETAALPLSYVGARASIGDELRNQLFGVWLNVIAVAPCLA
jgi:hypothetical protein